MPKVDGTWFQECSKEFSRGFLGAFHGTSRGFTCDPVVFRAFLGLDKWISGDFESVNIREFLSSGAF